MKAVVEFLRRLKTEHVTVQTDNEEAIVSLMTSVVESVPDLRVKIQRSPVGSSESSGAAERVVRTITQLTLTSALDFATRTGCTLGKKDRMLK